MKRVEFVTVDVTGYCASWPLPPITPKPVPTDHPDAEEDEVGNQYDRDKTTKQADLINEDWKRRCPEQWEEFKKTLT